MKPNMRKSFFLTFFFFSYHFSGTKHSINIFLEKLVANLTSNA